MESTYSPPGFVNVYKISNILTKKPLLPSIFISTQTILNDYIRVALKFPLRNSGCLSDNVASANSRNRCHIVKLITHVL